MTGCTRAVVVTIAILAFFALARPAAACSCAPKAPQCQALFDATTVFSGTVLSIETIDRPWPQRRVHFEVAEAFRGVTAPSVDIVTDADDDCAYPFVLNERYLVFAAHDGWSLSALTCGRTKALPDAQDDLSYLRSVASAPPAGGVLSGTVHHLNQTRGQWRPDEPFAHLAPVGGVAVSVECKDGVVHRTETTTGGRFEFRGLPVGACSPHVTPPALTYIQNPPRPVTIRDLKACVDIDVLVGYDGHIRGRVLDEGVRPLSGITVVTFLPALKARSSYSAITDASGTFDIARMPPGQYVIGINGRSAGESGPGLGRPIYFPGVETTDDAEVVTLGTGSEVDLGDFRLTSDVTFALVLGTVVDEDGSPISGVKVYVLKAGTDAVYGGQYATDSQGRFTLSVPRGESITLKALGRYVIGEATFVADTDQPAIWIVLKPMKH